MATNDTCCTIVPYFKINAGKDAAFRALCEQMVATTRSEPKCLYYGFSFDGDQAFCREGYEDAEGALAHLANITPLLEQLLAVSAIARLEVHGPDGELAKLRGPLAPFSPQFFTLDYGFRKGA